LIGRFNYMFTNTLDGMITAKRDVQMFPDPLGRDNHNESTITGELNWQLSTTTLAYVYDTYQRMDQSQSSVGGGASGCTYYGLLNDLCNEVPFAPYSYFQGITNVFSYDMSDKNNVLGIGASHLFDNKAKLDASYQYQITRTSVSYVNQVPGNCNGGISPIGVLGLGNYGCPAVVPASYVNGAGFYQNVLQFPDEKWDRQTFNLNYTYPVTAAAAVRVSYTFDKADEADWHYDGLCGYNNAPGDHYFLSCNPASSFKNQTIGVFLQYKM